MARGRHRRYKPNPVSRASLTVTASGAGIALPLVGVSHAQAAPVDIWDKVATCESTNTWDINTGNGYFGGLQFKQTTWQEFGGTAYAARADKATKQQQIAIAEKVLKKQGPGAWPTCSVRAGLTRDMAAPGGGSAGPEPQGASAAPKSAPQKAAGGQSGQDGSGGPEGKKGQGGKKASESYAVQRGDSLSAIASERNVAGGWQRLYESNRKVVGSDPDLIIPGQRLSLSPAGPGKSASGKSAPASPSADKAAQDAKAAQEAKAAKAAKEKAAQDKAAKAEAAKEKAAKDKAAKEKAEAEKKQAEAKQAKASAPSYTSPVSGYSPGTAYRASGANWSSGYHTGVDFPVPTGTTIKSVTSGTIVSAGWEGSYGYQVVVRHQDGRHSQYAHLSAITVRSGQKVNAGQRLGRSGNTGNSTGPHLHFEIRSSPAYGSDIDPLAYLRGKGVTI